MGFRGLLLLAVLLLPPLPAAAKAAGEKPIVSILIDDVGPRLDMGRRAIELPGPIAYAFLPNTPHAVALARAAHARGKEVLLHQPMQAVADGPLGPGAVTLDMEKTDFLRTLEANLASIPHVSGVNNHMGSLLTRHPGHMSWLMQDLKRRGNLFFVDSRTTAKTVAEQMAREAGVPVLRRHVFLDHELSREAVNSEFDRLMALARRRGAAVAIGHPHAVTLDVLAARLPELQAAGIELVPLRQMLEREKRSQP